MSRGAAEPSSDTGGIASDVPSAFANRVAGLGARRQLLVGVALFVFAAALFAPSVRSGFAMDDRSIVQGNELIRDLDNLGRIWTTDYWYPEIASGLYRPIVITSYAFNYAIDAANPRGYHLINVLLHALVTVLVWRLYLRTSRDGWLAAAAAALFAAHAIHTEVVANVAAGRPELLGAMFFLIALIAHARREDAPAGRRLALHFAALVCFAAGLLCKESVATLPGVVVLHDLLYATDPERPWLRRLARLLRERGPLYASYAAVLVGMVTLRIAVLGSQNALPPEIALDNPLVLLNWDWRILNALSVSLRYLGLFLLPLHLSYDYSYNQIPLTSSLSSPVVWLTVAAWTAIGVLAVVLWRRSRLAFFWLGFWAVTFSVVSNVIVPIGTIFGERLLYVPSIGLCLLLALLLRAGLREVAPPRAAAIAFAGSMAVIVALHAVRSLDRVEDWKTEQRLYLRDLESVPRSAKAMNNAAAMLVSLERHEEAVELFEKAVEVAPQYTQAWQTGGYTYEAMGRLDDALRMYEGALRTGSKEVAILNNLGFHLADREIDIARGVVLLERAADLYPDNAEVLDSLGWAYFKAGRLQDARARILSSLELDSWSPSTKARRDRLAQVEEALAQGGHGGE